MPLPHRFPLTALRLAGVFLLGALSLCGQQAWRYAWSFDGAPKIQEWGTSTITYLGRSYTNTYATRPDIRDGLTYCKQICVRERNNGTFEPYSYERRSPATEQYAGLVAVTTVSEDGVLTATTDLNHTDAAGYTSRWGTRATLNLRTGEYLYLFHSHIDGATSDTVIDIGVRAIASLTRSKVAGCVDTGELRVVMPDSNATATGLSADGDAAVRLIVTTASTAPVTFTITPSTTAQGNAAGLTLSKPTPGSAATGNPSLEVTPVRVGDQYEAVAWLRAPDTSPTMLQQIASIQIRAVQGARQLEGGISLKVPPLLLVHGIWSGGDVWDKFLAQLYGLYPGRSVYPLNYRASNFLSFTDPATQLTFLRGWTAALNDCREQRVSCAQVDVVAHSMGGLVTRYASPAAPLNKVITIGTPHLGSPLASTLLDYADRTPTPGTPISVLYVTQPRLREAMGNAGMTVDTGVASIATNSLALLGLPIGVRWFAIQGIAPATSVLQTTLNQILASYNPPLTGHTVGSLLGAGHDVIVPAASQLAGAQTSFAINNITHSGPVATGETETTSPEVVAQVARWLLGSAGSAVKGNAESPARESAIGREAAVGSPIDLTGWTPAVATITTLPADGTEFVVPQSFAMSVTSNKAIERAVALSSSGMQESGGPSPSFPQQFLQTGIQEIRLLVLHTDRTYSVRTITYRTRAATPVGLSTIPEKLSESAPGQTYPVAAIATFDGLVAGRMDVSGISEWSMASGTSSVATVDQKGNVRLLGKGRDAVLVKLNGVTATVPVEVGDCTTRLDSPVRGAPLAGGSLTVGVLTQAGCAWTATSATPWVTVTPASGSGPGSVVVTVGANDSAVTRGAMVAIAGATLSLTQAGQGCTLTLGSRPSLIAAAGGTVSVTGSIAAGCPWSAASGADWLTLDVTGNVVGSASIPFTAAPNNTGVTRSAVVNLGPETLTITQPSAGCDPTLPAAVSIPASGSTSHSIPLTTGSACRSTVSNPSRWVQVFPPESTGSTVFAVTVYPNFTTQQRVSVVTIGGRTHTITQAANTLSEDERVVQFAYFNHMGRLPGPAELQGQVANLRSGILPSRTDLFDSFVRSEEFNLGGRFVAGLYVGLLARNAEFDGWLFQRNAMSAGSVAPLTLVTNFLSSAEFGLRHGSLDNSAFIRVLYRYILLREAAEGEVAFHSDSLTRGLTRTQVAANFLNSAEFRIGTGPRISTFLLFATILNRDPSALEQSQGEARIVAGTSLRTLMQEMLNSAEFRSLLQ